MAVAKERGDSTPKRTRRQVSHALRRHKAAFWMTASSVDDTVELAQMSRRG
ncbi:hypothetical protein [Rhodanobacter sp. DHB23]|uniref:hypothetical protein n=1 Tax=Rhodanobacter sp. DHB23 TaxID=2775923 RepID=UPI00177D8E74|nr:hypothetical protein [Rhodanobacter sp. DHB23]MBD8874315.1 hypothetical protein [Rhodanobacter sp. DHB23]